MLEHDQSSSHGKEHFTFALRNLELVQPQEIEMLLDTIMGVKLLVIINKDFSWKKMPQDLHENERKTLETIANEKLNRRNETLEKSNELKKKLKL